MSWVPQGPCGYGLCVPPGDKREASLHRSSWILGENQSPSKTLAQGQRTRTDRCHSGHIAVGQVRGPLLACQSEHELPVCLPACPLANLGVDKVLLKGLTWLAKDNNNNKIKSFLLSFEYLMMRDGRQSRSCYSYSHWLYPLYPTSSYTHRGAESLSQRSSGPMLSEISTMQLSAKSHANRATHRHR